MMMVTGLRRGLGLAMLVAACGGEESKWFFGADAEWTETARDACAAGAVSAYDDSRAFVATAGSGWKRMTFDGVHWGRPPCERHHGPADSNANAHHHVSTSSKFRQGFTRRGT